MGFRSKVDLLKSWLRPQPVAATARWLRRALATARGRGREVRLTVAVDVAAYWEPLTGIGWYLHHILEELADRDDLRLRLYPPRLLSLHQQPPPVAELPRGAALELVGYEVPIELERWRKLIQALLRLVAPILVAADRNDVLFAPNYFMTRRFRLASGKLVATIHDLGLYTCSETMAPETVRLMERHLPAVLASADRLITDSASVRDELIEHGLAAADRVICVPLGPGHLDRTEAGTLPEGVGGRFALHVGTVEPRKNLALLLDVWRRLRLTTADTPPLVLCGRLGWHSDDIREELDAAAAEGWLLHLGYVDARQLRALYESAEVVLLPTVYEGFGLPAVEAMAAGTPLVASDIPVLREVAGDAAVFVPVNDGDAWVDRVREVLSNQVLRHRMIVAGTAHVARFDWRQTADATAEVWRETVRRSP